MSILVLCACQMFVNLRLLNLNDATINLIMLIPIILFLQHSWEYISAQPSFPSPSFLKKPFCFCTCLIVKVAGDGLIRKLLSEEKLGESVSIAS